MSVDAAHNEGLNAMYARALEEVSDRLHDLRRVEREDVGLAAVALALAVACSWVFAPLALPLLVGGAVIGVRGLRALWLRSDVVEQLTWNRDAYVLPEVRKRAAREATFKRRHQFAAVLRGTLNEPLLGSEDRLGALRGELEDLATELDDERLAFDPAAAVLCASMLSDFEESPLLDPRMPDELLRSRLRQIRAGFSPRQRP
jgi:hypothetical protein